MDESAPAEKHMTDHIWWTDEWLKIKSSDVLGQRAFLVDRYEKLRRDLENAGELPTERLVDLVWIGQTLAYILVDEGDATSAEMLYMDAVEQAKITGRDQVIFTALTHASLFYRAYGDPSRAVPLLQESIKYSRELWLINLLTTFGDLAALWSLDEASWPRALLMYEWLCLIMPKHLGYMIGRNEL